MSIRTNVIGRVAWAVARECHEILSSSLGEAPPAPEEPTGPRGTGAMPWLTWAEEICAYLGDAIPTDDASAQTALMARIHELSLRESLLEERNDELAEAREMVAAMYRQLESASGQQLAVEFWRERLQGRSPDIPDGYVLAQTSAGDAWYWQVRGTDTVGEHRASETGARGEAWRHALGCFVPER